MAFLKFILEAYDGIATMTTFDSVKGEILLQIGPGCESVVEELLKDLGKDISIQPIKNPGY